MEIYMNELTTESPYELHKDIKFIKEIDQGAFGKVIHPRRIIKVKILMKFFYQNISHLNSKINNYILNL